MSFLQRLFQHDNPTPTCYRETEYARAIERRVQKVEEDLGLLRAFVEALSAEREGDVRESRADKNN